MVATYVHTQGSSVCEGEGQVRLKASTGLFELAGW